MIGRIICGDALEEMAKMEAESVHCVVTSPPYWNLRDYQVEGQLGLEPTPDLYVEHMVEIFREVRRVLRNDGTLWLNLGDSYAGGGRGKSDSSGFRSGNYTGNDFGLSIPANLKPKDLCGIPWRVALALQADGWWLRSDIIWAKSNPMPESVTDRPTKSHEYLFLMSKSAKYYYDQEAVKTDASGRSCGNRTYKYDGVPGMETKQGILAVADKEWHTRNIRSVWTIPTHSFSAAHFATFPPALVEPCIKAGTSERGVCLECGKPWERVVKKSGGTTGKSWHDHSNDLGKGQRKNESGMDTYRVNILGWRPGCTCDKEPVPATVLDPFFGAGTVGLVASRLGRSFIGIELNPAYAEMARRRIEADAPLLTRVEER